VEEWVKAGIKVYSCYEAGACGYWYHRELSKCGAVNYVVAPRALENQRRKHQKTERLDARALLENLESYLRGNRDAMSIVAVPSPLQEQQRSVVRYREQLVRNRRRAEARGRALALTQGILAPVGWWRPARWKQFKTQLPEWMAVREKIDASSFALILRGVLLFVFLVNRIRGTLFPEPLGIFRFRLASAGSASP
jgi:hypothetical protein